MAHGNADEIVRAKAILATSKPSRLDVHAGARAAQPMGDLVHAAG